jgi:hypothetical protein
MQYPTTHLAAALAEWTDPVLARGLRCDERVAARLRFYRPPRADHWHADVEALARELELPPARLARVLREGPPTDGEPRARRPHGRGKV